MRNRVFKFQFSRATISRTILHFAIVAAVAAGIFLLYDSEFIMAWYVSFVVGLLLLMMLSIPRNIEVSDDSVTINCMLDMTEISIDDIVVIRKVSPRRISLSVPIFGGNGLFGYYGHFFDLRHFRRFVIYAREWNHFVEIVDVYEDYYYLSCRSADEFIRCVKERM